MVCIKDIRHVEVLFWLHSVYTQHIYEIRNFLGNKDTNMVQIMTEFITFIQQYLKRRQANGGLNRRRLYQMT